jgi:hypothetical protein
MAAKAQYLCRLPKRKWSSRRPSVPTTLSRHTTLVLRSCFNVETYQSADLRRDRGVERRRGDTDMRQYPRQASSRYQAGWRSQ